MAHDVFISYSQKDKVTADAACAALEAAGIRCWIAPRDVLAGKNWGGSIVRAIGESRVMMLVFSSQSNNSQQVLREVERAVNKGVVVVPFRIEDVKPSEDLEYYLSAPHWLDAVTPPLAVHLQRLCQTVRVLLATLNGGQDAASAAPQLTTGAAPTVVGDDRVRHPPRNPAGRVSAARQLWERFKRFANRPRLAVSAAIAITLMVCLSLVWLLGPPTLQKVSNHNADDAAPSLQKSGSATPNTFAGATVGQTRNDNGLKTTLVWIPPGNFTMGSPIDEKDRGDNENQVQMTFTRGFWMGQHELTQAEWRRVMQSTPWSGREDVKEGDNFPAIYVSWDDATNFCEKLTVQEHGAGRLPFNWRYSLPTEAQWEYACRGGSKSRFSFANDDSALADYAWYEKNGWKAGEKFAHLVGQKKSNPWGLLDMHGNVCEWCRDRYEKFLSGGSDRQVPADGTYRVYRVYRGGNVFDPAGYCRSAFRYGYEPDHQDKYLGFRVAVVPSAK
jgi:formylglycine-generating enzyme required for sulfatase activity